MFKNIPEEIPAGYQIFDDRLEVAGINYWKANAHSFSASKNKWLEFEREPENKHDQNAIKIIGCIKGLFGVKRLTLGYIPKEISKKIIERGYFQKVLPRLIRSFNDDEDSLYIYFQILGPKGEKYLYNPPKTEEGGRYYEYIDRVKQLKSERRYEEAEILLLKLVKDVEKEAIELNWGVPPWYYEQLAIIYRKGKHYEKEIEILERYFKYAYINNQEEDSLFSRLIKAKQLHEKCKE